MRYTQLAFCAVAFPMAALPGQSSAHNSRIVGVVADSVSGAPLRGAEVVVGGVGATVTTDSLGRFTIDSLSPGTYQVGIFHPLLESLGITLATKPFAIGPDSAGVVNLAVPSVATLVKRYCGADQPAATPSSVVGRVLDPETDVPIAGAKVSLAWTEIAVSKEAGVVRTPHQLDAQTNEIGFFKFCALPSDLDGTLQVVRGEALTPEVPVTVGGALLAFQSMSIPASGAPRASGVVTGHVVTLAGKPVSGARVEVPMSSVSTVTRDDGSFRLSGVLTGTQVIVARSLSYSSAAEAINVTSREPIDVVVTLGPSVALLDPVLITARRDLALEKSGFSARKRAGGGHFFTREDIDRRQPNNITDMMKNLTGITVTQRRGGAVISGRSRVTSMYSAPSCSRVYVDGFEWDNLMPGDLDMFVNPDDVIGLEIYQPGDVPIKFRKFDRGCVTLVVWTQMRSKAKK
jgi:hypothetical protein